MPDRPLPPNLGSHIADLEERIRRIERHTHIMPEFDESKTDIPPSYSWQSTRTLSPGLGHKLHTDRQGRIVYVRAERSSADGTSLAEFDVLKNGSSIFDPTNRPRVSAGDALGPEIRPRVKTFKKGDSLQVEIITTGGGTGPLRVTIHFIEKK